VVIDGPAGEVAQLRRPVVLSFSGGKDSILALAALHAAGWEIRAALACFAADDHALVAHGVPEQLVSLQAASLGIALARMTVPRDPPNTIYEAQLADALAPYRAQGVRHVVFGDLFLADIKAYRDELITRLGFEPVYPLCGENTRALADGFVRAGYRGVTVCVDASKLGPEWVGREMDAAFFAELPQGIDPCGENGEFHSFVWDGPGFFYPVRFERATSRRTGGFHYCELSSVSGTTCASCGAIFECGAKAGAERCWCATLPSIAPDASRPDCLCPSCLRRLVAQRSATFTGRSAPDPRSPRDP